MYKYSRSLLAKSFKNKYTLSSETHDCKSRNSYQLFKERTNLFKNSLKYMGSDVWNTVPDKIKSLPNLNIFKTNLKRRPTHINIVSVDLIRQ